MDPDDLVQEALARALRTRTLAELANPGAYVRRTIVNLAANERRRLGRGRRALHRVGATATAEPPTYPSDIGDLLQLEPTARVVLYLAEVEGRSYVANDADTWRLVSLDLDAASSLDEAVTVAEPDGEGSSGLAAFDADGHLHVVRQQQVANGVDGLTGPEGPARALTLEPMHCLGRCGGAAVDLATGYLAAAW